MGAQELMLPVYAIGAIVLPLAGWILWGSMRLAKLEQSVQNLHDRIAQIERQLELLVRMLTKV
jgi:hypothetical protein